MLLLPVDGMHWNPYGMCSTCLVGFVSKLRGTVLRMATVLHVVHHYLHHPGTGPITLPPALISPQAIVWARLVAQQILLQQLIFMRKPLLFQVRLIAIPSILSPISVTAVLVSGVPVS